VNRTALVAVLMSSAPATTGAEPIGRLIWSAETTEKQSCRLWRSFEIPADTPGRHVLAIRGFNEKGPARVAVALRIERAAGEPLIVVSDSSWRVVPAAVHRASARCFLGEGHGPPQGRRFPAASRRAQARGMTHQPTPPQATGLAPWCFLSERIARLEGGLTRANGGSPSKLRPGWRILA